MAPENSNKQRTPGLWTVGAHPGNGAGTGWRTILAQGMPFPNSYVGEALEQDANAIVHAVNCHDELVEALKALLADNERAYPADLGNVAAAQARAAIAKAEGR